MTQVATQKKLYPALIGEVGITDSNRPYGDTRRVGVVGNTVADDYAKLNTLVNVNMQLLGGGQVDIYGVPRIASNLVIPANIKLNFVAGAYLAPDLGVTVTINGAFDPSLVKIFGGGGTIAPNRFAAAKLAPEHFGAVGDGVTPDHNPILQWANSLKGVGSEEFNFTRGQTYVIGGSVAFTIPEHSTVKARGVRFTGTFDGVLFNLNPNQVFDGTDATTIRGVSWEGGWFTSTAATKTASVAIKAVQMRDFLVERTRIDEFWVGIFMGGKDSLRFKNNLIHDCTYGIYQPYGLMVNGGDFPLEIEVLNNYFSGNGCTAFLAIYDHYTGLKVRGNSFNGDAPRQIDLRDGTILTNFGTYVENNHFEQMVAGSYCLYMDDVHGLGWEGLAFNGNTIATGSPGWRGLNLQRVRGIKIGGANQFNDGSGGSTEIIGIFGPNCLDIEIDSTNRYTGPIVAGGYWQFDAAIPRSRISLLPSYRAFDFPVPGYQGVPLLGTVANEVIDMKTKLGALYPLFGTPKGYWVEMFIQDPGSLAAAANTIYAKLRATGAATSNADLHLGAGGAPNGEKRSIFGFVACDANGSISMDRGTSAGTMTVSLVVKALEM